MKRLVLLAGAGLVFIGWLALMTSGPRKARPWTPMSVAFVGYTNSGAGGRSAIFCLTNSGHTPVTIASLGLEMEAHPNEVYGATLSPLPWPAGRMKGRSVETFAVVEPAEAGRWRVFVRFSRWTFRERLQHYATNHRWPILAGWVQQYRTNSIWLNR